MEQLKLVCGSELQNALRVEILPVYPAEAVGDPKMNCYRLLRLGASI